MAKSSRIFNGVGMISDLPPIVPSEGRLTDLQVAYLVDSLRNIIRTVNGLLSFGNGSNSSQSGNIDGQTKEVTFVTANADYEVPHGLGRVPIGIIVLNVNVDGAVVRGGSVGSWSDTRLFVRCNQAGATALFVVV
jgi:hypothetical protein